MATPRFLVTNLPDAGSVELDSTEAKHASSVLRLTEGDCVVVFDGKGAEAIGFIEHVSKRCVTVLIQSRSSENRELSFALELLVALPKGERQRTLTDGLTQLGVSKLTPLTTQRGVAQPTDNALQRLRRSVIETSKQCGRNFLMEVAEPVAVSSLPCPTSDSSLIRLFAHPYGEAQDLTTLVTCNASRVQLAVGPEGGFTDEEVGLLKGNGWQQVSLGPRILRVEMASIALASWWSLGHRPTN